MHTSLGTYVRAFAHPLSPAAAAGNYKNTVATLIAKGVVGFLTAGIGLGIICLIEHYGNVVPKIREFARNSKLIYEAIERHGDAGFIEVTLEDGRVLRLRQFETQTGAGPVPRVIFELEGENPVALEEATFESMRYSLRKDYERNPALYDHVYGPVAERASALINDDFDRMPLRGTVSVMNKIRNALFLCPIPTTEAKFVELLSTAFVNATGVELSNSADPVRIPLKKAQGMQTALLTPNIFAQILREIVADATNSPNRHVPAQQNLVPL